MTRQESAPIVAARLPPSTQWIICFILTVILAPTLRAQNTSALAERLAHNRLEANELSIEQSAGKITPQDFTQRTLRNQAEFTRIETVLRALPPATHAAVSQEASAIYQREAGKLQAQWAQTQNDARQANEETRQQLLRERQARAQIQAPAIPPPADGTSPVAMPPPIPDPISSAAGGSVLRYIWLALAAVVAAAGGFWFWRRRSKSAAGEGAGLPAAPRSKAAPVPIPKVVSAPPAAPAALARTIPSVAASGAGAAGAPRERVLEQVKAKYQASITAAMDALTETQIELQRNANVPEAIRQELRRIGDLVYDTLDELLSKRLLSNSKAFKRAVMLRPTFEFFKRRFRLGSFVLKFLMGLVVLLVIGSIFPPLLNGVLQALPTPVAQILLGLLLLVKAGQVGLLALYVIVVAIGFFRERSTQKRGATAGLAASAAGIKQPRLQYVYANQPAEGGAGALTFRMLRVSSAKDQPLTGEITLPGQADDSVLGGFVLDLDTVATYRSLTGGSFLLLHPQPGSILMSSYSSIVTEALMRHAAAFEPLFEALRGYGDIKWREHQQSADIPRVEKLIDNVTKLERIWQGVAVADNVFDFLIRRIDLFNLRENAAPNGILLLGYPGNGKEYLARKIAESTFAQFVKLTAEQLASPQAIKALWQTQAARAPVVLFVDYAEQFFARAGEQESAGREARLAWLEEWSSHVPSKSSMWVVMSAQNEDNLHPRVLAQFGQSKIEIQPPNATGRELILADATRENQLPGTAPRWLIDMIGGTSIRDLRELVRETRMQSVPEPPTDTHWREAAGSVLGSGMSEAGSDPWARVILPEEIKSRLQRAARILREADRYKDKKVKIPNILLFGPPGTGKTEIAKTFAKSGGVKFVSATTADIKGQYVGQSAGLVRDLFARARASAPCVLFIDEMESVAAKRGSPTSDQFTQDIVTEMLAQMEGAKTSDRAVIVLGATNLPDQIDPAILDRFTSRIEIALPDEAGRKEMLQRLIADRPVDPSLNIEEVSTLLAKSLKRKSGRELVKMIDRAMELAVGASDTSDDVYLTRDLLMKVAFLQGKAPNEAELQKIWDQIVLKPDVKTEVLDKIRLFTRGDKAAPRGMLLYGPPGTGKTEIARRIADSAGCKFLPLKGSDLKAGYSGQSGQLVKKKWEEARAFDRCVMFVDECEGVFARRGGTNTDSLSEELVQAFLAEWDGFGSEDQRVWVIGATNRRDILDEAIVQRFEATIEIGLPGAAERMQILGLEIDKLDRKLAVPAFVGAATNGMSGRILSALVREVCTQADKNGGVADDAIWREAIKRHKKSGSTSVDEEGLDWESLIVQPETIKQLKTVCASLSDLENLRRQGIALPKGALLYGPPGTGKTQIARTLASQSGLPFLAASTADLKAGFIGQSGQKTHDVFERARAVAPCILFIDEIDAVCPQRGSSNSDQFTVEIVNQFLQETEGVKATPQHVYVLGATNRPEVVDEAVRSRLKDTIEVPLPDEQMRQRLLKLMLTKLKRVDFDIDQAATDIARRTKKLGGRALSGLVDRASQRSVSRAYENGTKDNIVLTLDDLMQELQPERTGPSAADLTKIWDQIVLKPQIKEEILDKIQMFNRGDKAAPSGLLLFGPPGTGKTELARRIADSAGCAFLSLKGPDLKAGFIGGSGERVMKKWQEARAQKNGCVMFIDECEGIFARRGGTNTDSASEELVQAFLAEWDGVGSEDQRVWVIGATNRRDILDEAIVQRFGATIEIGLPGAPERLQILGMEIRKLGRNWDVPESLGSATTGMSGRNLKVLAREVCTLAEKQGGANASTWTDAIKRLRPNGGGEPVAGERVATWESLVLPEEVLNNLRMLCETLRHMEEFRAQGIDIPKGALLYGPPGTGKTQIARTMAKVSGLSFIPATTADLKAGFTGQSGQKTRELFERARGTAPCILFIDEIDAVAPIRGGRRADTFTGEIVNQLLQEMDGVKASSQHVFVLAATNLPDDIDPAVLQRFEERIEILKPDEPQRQRLFQLMLGNKPVDFDRNAVAAELAGLTPGTAGREIDALIQRASRLAVRRAAGDPKSVMLTRADLLASVPTRPAG